MAARHGASLGAVRVLTVVAGAPTASALLATWRVHLVVLVAVAAAAGLYAWGMARVRRRHPARPWPLGRAASFAGGLGVLVVAVMSAIGRYDTTFFWVHMIQHLLLIMVAPALLIHGRPLTLAMHATRNPLHTRIKRFLRSRAVTVVTCPLFAIPLYAAIVVGTHLTSFNNEVVRYPPVASAEQVAYLVAGYLYLLSGFGEEPIRWRLSRPAKMVVILLSMPIDTFTGLTLLTTRNPPWSAYAAQHHSWGPDPVTDVHWGGAMMWIGGDTIMIALIVTALIPGSPATPAAAVPGCAGLRAPAGLRSTATRLCHPALGWVGYPTSMSTTRTTRPASTPTTPGSLKQPHTIVRTPAVTVIDLAARSMSCSAASAAGLTAAIACQAMYAAAVAPSTHVKPVRGA